MRIRAGVLVVVTALPAVFLAPGVMAHTSSRPAAATGTKTIKRFIAANMTNFSGGAAQAVALASSTDVIAAHPGQFDAYFAQMRSANPTLVLLGYLSATFNKSRLGLSYPEAYYLHSATGARVSSGTNNYAMDPGNAGWQADRVAHAQALVSTGYDGVFFDSMGPAPTTPGYLSAIPMNPRTGQAYTALAWMNDTAAMASLAKVAVGPTKQITGNGLGSASAFFDPVAPTAVLTKALDAANAESWIRKAGTAATGFPSPSKFQAAVQMLTAAAATGRTVFVQVKMWGSGTATQIDQWHRFSLATFLLGATGADAYEFSPTNTEAGILGDSAYEHVQIGSPTAGPSPFPDGHYERQFATGLVVVNPTGSTVTVPLAKSYINLSAQTVSSSLVLPANSGDILQG
jgi:hypothetical protein